MGLSIDWNEKSLSAGPCEVSSMDLTINPKCLIIPLAPGDIIYLRLRVTAGAGYHQEGACNRLNSVTNY